MKYKTALDAMTNCLKKPPKPESNKHEDEKATET